MDDTQRPMLVLKTGAGTIDLLNPTPEQVNVDDMLHNLSRIPRWCGAGKLSVLQHMMVVSQLLRDVTCKTCRRALAALARRSLRYG